MEKVSGIGGFFFRASSPDTLSDWYETRLGVNPVNYEYTGQPDWVQDRGETVFAPFPKDTDYFGRPEQQWMLNFRVDDLDAIVRQLRRLGEIVAVESKTQPNGRFARLNDPEGNPIELWEPMQNLSLIHI